MWRAPFVLLILSGCAEPQRLPPGTELEEHAEPAPAAAPADAGPSEMPVASDKELATAWEPQKPKPPPPTQADKDALPPDEETVQRQLSAQAEAETRAKLKDLLVGGKRALATKAFDDAKTIAQGAIEL